VPIIGPVPFKISQMTHCNVRHPTGGAKRRKGSSPHRTMKKPKNNRKKGLKEGGREKQQGNGHGEDIYIAQGPRQRGLTGGKKGPSHPGRVTCLVYHQKPKGKKGRKRQGERGGKVR